MQEGSKFAVVTTSSTSKKYSFTLSSQKNEIIQKNKEKRKTTSNFI